MILVAYSAFVHETCLCTVFTYGVLVIGSFVLSLVLESVLYEFMDYFALCLHVCW